MVEKSENKEIALKNVNILCLSLKIADYFQERNGDVYALTSESEISSLNESEFGTLKANYDKVKCFIPIFFSNFKFSS